MYNIFTITFYHMVSIYIFNMYGCFKWNSFMKRKVFWISKFRLNRYCFITSNSIHVSRTFNIRFSINQSSSLSGQTCLMSPKFLSCKPSIQRPPVYDTYFCFVPYFCCYRQVWLYDVFQCLQWSINNIKLSLSVKLLRLVLADRI